MSNPNEIHADHHVGHVSTYIIVFLGLLVGTGLTVWAAFQDWGIFNAPAALLIACVKAGAVVLFFMHVKDSNKLIKTTVVGGIFWLLILFTLTMTDFLTRGWH
jgi:cytochrome c oxidase subunit 4